jgi:hypothetical protein
VSINSGPLQDNEQKEKNDCHQVKDQEEFRVSVSGKWPCYNCRTDQETQDRVYPVSVPEPLEYSHSGKEEGSKEDDDIWKGTDFLTHLPQVTPDHPFRYCDKVKAEDRDGIDPSH